MYLRVIINHVVFQFLFFLVKYGQNLVFDTNTHLKIATKTFFNNNFTFGFARKKHNNIVELKTMCFSVLFSKIVFI